MTEEVLKKIESLRKKLIQSEQKYDEFSEQVSMELNQLKESLDNFVDILNTQLPLIVKLLSSQVKTEDLERIEEEFGEMKKKDF